MASLGKYINVGPQTSAGTKAYRLILPDGTTKGSTNLNELRQLRTEFLRKNPEYRGKKKVFPGVSKTFS